MTAYIFKKIRHTSLLSIHRKFVLMKGELSVVPLDQKRSLDEQMYFTKAAPFMKQYLFNEPHK